MVGDASSAEHLVNGTSTIDTSKRRSARSNISGNLPAASGLASPAGKKSFDRLAAAAQAAHGALILAVLDIDHFRPFRNLYGIEVAHALLRAISLRLDGAAALAGGEIVRLDTDEFAIIVPARGTESATATWTKTLLAKASQPFTHRGVGYPFSATLGFAHLPVNGKTAPDALRCARLAVTQGKNAGGGTAALCSDIELEQARGRDELARDLPAAIARGELLPFYQPVISLHDGSIVGMEVLARWIHPQLGLLSPLSFIPLAEEQGLCCALTRELLNQVQEDARVWPRHWSFAFNAAPKELADILGFIEGPDTVSQTMIAPERIELEVTETSLMNDISALRSMVSTAQPFGIKLVLDDFGTGYANFQQLRDIPFSKLKIDKSFITHMLDDRRAEGCVQAIINLAHHLGMAATAEGVEMPGTAIRLAQMGCDYAQGYHYARPMPAAEVLWLLQEPRFMTKGLNDAA